MLHVAKHLPRSLTWHGRMTLSPIAARKVSPREIILGKGWFIKASGKSGWLYVDISLSDL